MIVELTALRCWSVARQTTGRHAVASAKHPPQRLIKVAFRKAGKRNARNDLKFGGVEDVAQLK
jgi:hypothetical protein